MLSLCIFVFVVVLDQMTKAWALENLSKGQPIVLIDKLLEFSYVENRGAAFGILQGKSFILIGVTVLVCLYIAYYLYKNYSNMSLVLKISLSLILSGAVGNLIDRVIRKFVVDFIFVRFWGYYDFPVFNVADIAVVVGSILLIYVFTFTKEIE